MEIGDLRRQIKHNCNISDAQYWGYYSICGLLTRLRELYLSEHSLMPWDRVPKEEMSPWIHERETLWKDLEGTEVRPLLIDGQSIDPLDPDCLNEHLRGTGLLYGSGYGAFHKKTFFLARLESVKELYDYRIHFTGEELCRDLTAPPAMLQGRCIYIRLHAIRSLIWDKFQEFRGRRYGGVLQEMFSCWGLANSDVPEGEVLARIETMVRDVSELFVMHEVGEAFEDDHSEEWMDILQLDHDMYTEFSLRATKDLIADTSMKGPLNMIITGKDLPLMAAYTAFLDGMRKEMFPEIRNAFQSFLDTRDWSVIERARAEGYDRAVKMRKAVVDLWTAGRGAEGFPAEAKRYYKAGCQK